MKRALDGHEVRTVSEMMWSGITNGKLLALAASHFDIFITVDKNMSRQQNLATLPLPVIEIRSRSIRWADVSPHVDEVSSWFARNKALYTRVANPEVRCAVRIGECQCA